MSKKIAFFDFDGTITTDDSLLKFIRFVVGDSKFIIGLIFLSPILIAYKLKLIPNYKAKQKMLSWFFKGYNTQEFLEVANKYSLHHIDNIIRQKAMQKIQWHQQQGDEIVIVSASIKCWLQPWCDKQGIDLIATELEFRNGKVSGLLKTKNCYGKEKVKRIKEKYNISTFDCIYAYGDSRGDKEMLELANEKYYKPFRQ